MDVAKLTTKDWLALPSLPSAFYRRRTPLVARGLLGKAIVRVWRGRPLVGIIVEVEAYLGDTDPASHAFRGPTPRNAAMFRECGHCYVYVSYGMHHCMNVVTGPEGVGQRVLIRALEPVVGLEQMARFRGVELDEARRPSMLRRLTSGPGRLTEALAVDLAHTCTRFGGGDLRLVDVGRRVPAARLGVSGRVGISKAVDEPLRFFVKDSPYVSR